MAVEGGTIKKVIKILPNSKVTPSKNSPKRKTICPNGNILPNLVTLGHLFDEVDVAAGEESRQRLSLRVGRISGIEIVLFRKPRKERNVSASMKATVLLRFQGLRTTHLGAKNS